MIHQHHPVPLWEERAEVRSCWMCGTHLPADQMVADGTSACTDIRWYCRDAFACTKRWTSRSATSPAIRRATAESSKVPDEVPDKAPDTETADADVAEAVPA